jgi:hypothetical protein
MRGISKHHQQGSIMKKFLKMLIVGTAIAVGCNAAAGAADSPDPVVGNWTLNVAKSKFPAGAAPQSQSRTYTQSADGTSLTVTGVAPDGSAISQKSTFKYDGKDYPFTGSPDYDALALKKVNSSTVNSTMKLGGKTVGMTVRSISDHGKKLTLTTNLKNAKGKKYHAVAVFDRQ